MGLIRKLTQGGWRSCDADHALLYRAPDAAAGAEHDGYNDAVSAYVDDVAANNRRLHKLDALITPPPTTQFFELLKVESRNIFKNLKKPDFEWIRRLNLIQQKIKCHLQGPL